MKTRVSLLAAMVLLAGVARGEESLDRLVVNAAASLVDERLESVLKTLEALAETGEIQSTEWARMHPILARYQQSGLEGVVWFALPDGTYYTAEKGRQEQTLSDRSYFPRLLDGERAVGDLVTSRSTGQHVVIAAVPVKRDGRVIGALGASIYLDKLCESVGSCLGLPQNLSFAAVTAEGKVAMHADASMLLTQMAVPEDEHSVISALTGWRFIAVSR